MRLALASLAALALQLPGALARGEGARLGLRLELGAEYDSNPHRTEQVEGTSPQPITGSPLGRFVTSVDAAGLLGARHSLSLSVGLAGKAFSTPSARSEDVLVAEASGGWSVLAGSGTSFGVSAAYFDVFGSVDALAFRSATPVLRFERRFGDDLLTAGAGYRLFTFKPNGAYDFHGLTGFATYRHLFGSGALGGAEWEWTAGASAEDRHYASVRCTDISVCPGPVEAGLRRDQFYMAHLSFTRTGTFLAGAGLSGDANISNSYGESLYRGIVHVRTVVLLPWQLAVSMRAELVAARYREAVPLTRIVVTGATIEDERRSTVRLELARPVGGGVELGARYSLYTNEIAAGPARYRRQTALVFVAFQADAN
jgi:hypothetical protein